jgi:GH15 family glucan-1,4-alpha-glucosidase
MSKQIKDYALIGDSETAALVGRDGAIDFLCWPRFYSEACFAALLGDEENGCWAIAPGADAAVTRRYRPQTIILETRFETKGGAVALIDFMPPRRGEEDSSNIVRIIAGERGCVPIRMLLNLRFDYGRLTPWISESSNGTTEFVCGPHAVTLETAVPIQRGHETCRAEFTVSAGERKSFALRYRRSHHQPARPLDPDKELADTEQRWRDWTRSCTYRGPYRDAVLRSLVTIKAMASEQTGGIIAAPTMGLPEKIGGTRNWDYRFCWLRDTTFTLLSLLHSGFHEEARAWRDWLLRAVVGMPNDVQPIYGLAGEHRLPEWEIDWFGGFRGSKPVRAGNNAYRQFQLDVYGEVLDALHQSREQGIPAEDWSWRLQQALIEQVERIWHEPDSGIWEARHGREHFTHSRVMAWVAIDRAVRACEKHRLDWPLARWRGLRDTIHRDVCKNGFDEAVGGFVRSYETREPDAATLLIPIVGFLPANDPRVRRTVGLVERTLMADGLVMRYDTRKAEDGLPEGEGAFLACSFWYADNLVMQGREAEARRVFERVLTCRNDVGLLSEECDPQSGELLGNFPQALSHLSLVNTAHNLEQAPGPAHARSAKSETAKEPTGYPSA